MQGGDRVASYVRGKEPCCGLESNTAERLLAVNLNLRPPPGRLKGFFTGREQNAAAVAVVERGEGHTGGGGAQGDVCSGDDTG